MIRPAALAAIALLPGVAIAVVRFTDVSATAGLTYRQRATPFAVNAPPEAAEKATGGAAPGDYDGDGWVDILVTRVDAPPVLFRNRGDGTFTDVTAASGALATAVPAGSNGAGWFDVDADGDLDAYMTAVGTTRFHLFMNQGDGTFTEEAVARGAALESPWTHYGMSVAAGDYDRDGWLDLFVTEWRANPTPPAPPLPGRSQNRLLRNRGAEAPGFFTDMTRAAGVEVEDLPDVPTSVLGTPGFSPGFVDFDGDGWPDLTWVADWGNSRLFWNDGDGTFTDGTRAAGVGLERSGMGSTQDDFDGDGLIDWMTTSIFGRASEIPFGVSNQLYRNLGTRRFANVTAEAGVADGGFGWGVTGLDYDNDGDQDVLCTNGFLEPGHEAYELWLHDRTRLFENDGTGHFAEVGDAHGVADRNLGKAAFSFDYDRDGDLDVFIANHGGSPILYRNDGGNAGHWLQLRLIGTRSNREALGAIVTVDPDVTVRGDEQVQHLLGNANFLSHDERMVHVGLGDRTAPLGAVRVRWPSGAETTLADVAIDQRLTLIEGGPTLQLGFAATALTAAEGDTVELGVRVAGLDTRGVGPVSVTVAASGGSATAGTDYRLAPPAVLTIPPGDYRTPAVIPVSLAVLDDAEDEPDESIEVTLRDPVAPGQLDPAGSTVRLTIVDDDLTCTTATAGVLEVQRGKRATRWRWTFEATGGPALGDPRTSTGYDFTLADASGMVGAASIGPGPGRWRAMRGGGFRYTDAFGARGPVRLVTLAPSQAARKRRTTPTRIEIAGRDGLTARPLLFPVEARLVSSDGACWSAVFTSSRKRTARTTLARVR